MTRGTRVKFDKQDQDALASFLASWPGSIKGDAAYREFARTHPTHTWQSWRDHYLRNQELLNTRMRIMAKTNTHSTSDFSSVKLKASQTKTKRPRSSDLTTDPIVLVESDGEHRNQLERNGSKQRKGFSSHNLGLEKRQPLKKPRPELETANDTVQIQSTQTYIISSDSEPQTHIKMNKGKQRRRSPSLESDSEIASFRRVASQTSRLTASPNDHQSPNFQGSRRGITRSSLEKNGAYQQNPNHTANNLLLTPNRQLTDCPRRKTVILNPDEEFAFAEYMSGFPSGDIRLKDQLYEGYHKIAPAHSPESYRTYYLSHCRQLESSSLPPHLRSSLPTQSRPIKTFHLSNPPCAPENSPALKSTNESLVIGRNMDVSCLDIEKRDFEPRRASTPVIVTAPTERFDDLYLSSGNPVNENVYDDEMSLSLSSGSSDDADLQEIFDPNYDDTRLKPCYSSYREALRKLQTDPENSEFEDQMSKDENGPTNAMPIDQNEEPPKAREISAEKSSSHSVGRPASSEDYQLICTSSTEQSADRADPQSAATVSIDNSRTNTLCSRRRTRSGTVRDIPSGPVSMAMAIELMSEFLSDFGHIYTDADAVALFKRCGDWTLMFEVGSLMAEDAMGVVKGEEEKKYKESVMAMVWDEEEDKLLLTPDEQLLGRGRRRLRVLEKRKGIQAIANRRKFLAVLGRT
ncbi:hypothetical protein CROQUDRAFT_661305 [Cronartium quercuum f. sp. fusiforme G11]|uniref:DNA-binding protein RAP1 n=1 Tax=Cronartium quercuum f. sp. fusiforme G11 TaxID=708437 RepID=A0A9P6NFX9_9BASI|nr:hypothetical protein CROQUDRAFT_661305 [Cronartium quercuum f. sp. fusiforme G11]